MLNLIDSHKLNYHIPTLNKYLYEDSFKVFPIYLEISPVGYCNHKCSFCALDFYHPKAKLSVDTLYKTIDSLAKYHSKSIMFAGEGEPLLHKELPEVISYAANKHIDCAISSNGSIITKDMLHTIKKLTWAKFSVNAGDKNTYAKVHGCSKRQFDIVWDNLEAVVANSGKCDISVQSLVLPENINSISNLAKKCLKIGIKHLILKPYSQHRYSRTSTYCKIDYTKYYIKLHKLEQLYSTKDLKIIIRSNSMKYWDSQDRSYDKCYATPYLWAYIDSPGNVWACSCFISNKRFNLGNINEDKFEDIWYGSKRKQLIDYMNTEMNIKVCRVNCRMDKCNRYIHSLYNPPPHHNFI